MPQQTVSKHLSVGLERIRSRLAKAGYPAAGAGALLAALRAGAPAVPAGLSARLETVLAGALSAKTAAAAGAAALPGSMSLASKLVAAGALAATLGVGGAVVWKQLPPRGGAAREKQPPEGDGQGGREAKVLRELKLREHMGLGNIAVALRSRQACLLADGTHLYLVASGFIAKINAETGKSLKVSNDAAAREFAWDGKRLWCLVRRDRTSFVYELDRDTLRPKPGRALALPAPEAEGNGGGRRRRAQLVATGRGLVLVTGFGEAYQLDPGKRSWERLSPEGATRAKDLARGGGALSVCCYWGGRRWSIPRRTPSSFFLRGVLLPGVDRGGEPRTEEIALALPEASQVVELAAAGEGRFWIAYWDRSGKSAVNLDLLLLDTGVKALAAGPGGAAKGRKSQKSEEPEQQEKKASKQERQKDQGAEKKKE
jgi:hypothetical protein